MTNEVKYSTKKSIYPPIKIPIDGTVYESKKFTRALLLTIKPLEKKLDTSEPDWDALVQWLGIVFGMKEEILETLEQDEVEDMYVKVQVELLRRQKARMKKSIDAVKDEVQDVKDTIDKATETLATAEELKEDAEKKVKGPGKKE